MCDMTQELTGEPPKMWGSGIVGFGTCHYRYDSGREGGFHVRRALAAETEYLAVHHPGFEDQEALPERPGKHKTGQVLSVHQSAPGCGRHSHQDTDSNLV